MLPYIILLFASNLILMMPLNCLAQASPTHQNWRLQKPASRKIASYELIDVMPSFWEFRDEVQNQDGETKIRRFRELVLEPNKEVYKYFTGAIKADGAIQDEIIAKYLEKVRQYFRAMRKFYAQIKTELPQDGQKFKKRFPDANGEGAVYFMVNLLGGWDTGTGDLNGHPVLIFNIDSVLQIHGEDFNFGPLFHHELFHIYHAGLHPEWRDRSRSKNEIPFYWLLWTEALATYMSGVLNPRADETAILASKTLAAQSEPLLAKLAGDIRRQLDSGDAYANFLSGGPKESGIPPRSGYYIGMLIVKQFSRKYSLSQLARLGGDKLRKEMEAVLIKFESNSPLKGRKSKKPEVSRKSTFVRKEIARRLALSRRIIN